MKWSESWDSELVVTCILGIFDLLVFKVILGSFGALVLNCLKMACNSKMAGRGVKGSEIWDSWVVGTCLYMGYH